jgi:hypothetical protein
VAAACWQSLRGEGCACGCGSRMKISFLFGFADCVNKVQVFINFENYKQFLLVRDYLFLLIKNGIE